MHAFILFIVLTAPNGDLAPTADWYPTLAKCAAAKAEALAAMLRAPNGYALKSAECRRAPKNTGRAA
jgi:hypothetical protein